MQASENKTIAIIIPIYQVTQFLEETLKHATQQDYPGVEIIVVDDGSDKKAAAEIQRICALFPAITLLRQRNKGAAKARYFGLQHTKAEYVLFLDSDDILLPHAISTLYKGFDEHPDAVACYARLMKMKEDGELSGEAKPKEEHIASGLGVLDMFLKNKPLFCNGSVLVRRDALLSLPSDNHGLVLGEDWVLWCHLALTGKIYCASRNVVLHYRLHPQNTSKRLGKEFDLIFTSFRKIYEHPDFVSYLGKEKAARAYERAKSKVHAYLASQYAMSSELKKAQYHFDRVSVPISEIKPENILLDD